MHKSASVYQDGHFDIFFLCEFVHSNTILQRESLIVACVLMSSQINLLTAHASSHPLALKCLNWQNVHEFSLNTDINVLLFRSHLCSRATLSAPGRVMTEYMLIFQHTALALNKSEWFIYFVFHHCCCNVPRS